MASGPYKYVIRYWMHPGQPEPEFIDFQTVLEVEEWLRRQDRARAERAEVYQRIKVNYVPSAAFVQSRDAGSDGR